MLSMALLLLEAMAVRDYIGAMAQMLTKDELGTILRGLGIGTFTFYDSYDVEKPQTNRDF